MFASICPSRGSQQDPAADASPMEIQRNGMAGNTLNANFVLIIVKLAPHETIRRDFV
jgi:hypothetical protein